MDNRLVVTEAVLSNTNKLNRTFSPYQMFWSLTRAERSMVKARPEWTMSFSDAPCGHRTRQVEQRKRMMKSTVILTAIRAWNSEVGTTGMDPPCFPNFLSRLSWTDTEEKRHSYSSRSRSYRNPRVRLTQQMVVGVPLVLECEPTITDVVQVLQPLEIGDGDTPSVQIHVLMEDRDHYRT